MSPETRTLIAILLSAIMAGGLALVARATRCVALDDIESLDDVKGDDDAIFAHTWRGARWYLVSDWEGACAVLLSAFFVVLLGRAAMNQYMTWDQYSSLLFVMVFLATVYVWLKVIFTTVRPTLRRKSSRVIKSHEQSGDDVKR